VLGISVVEKGKMYCDIPYLCPKAFIGFYNGNPPKNSVVHEALTDIPLQS